VDNVLKKYSVRLNPEDFKALMQKNADEIQFDDFYNMVNKLDKEEKRKLSRAGSSSSNLSMKTPREGSFLLKTPREGSFLMKTPREKRFSDISPEENTKLINVFKLQASRGFLSRNSFFTIIKEGNALGGRHLTESDLMSVFNAKNINPFDKDENVDLQNFIKAAGILGHFYPNTAGQTTFSSDNVGTPRRSSVDDSGTLDSSKLKTYNLSATSREVQEIKNQAETVKAANERLKTLWKQSDESCRKTDEERRKLKLEFDDIKKKIDLLEIAKNEKQNYEKQIEDQKAEMDKLTKGKTDCEHDLKIAVKEKDAAKTKIKKQSPTEEIGAKIAELQVTLNTKRDEVSKLQNKIKS